MNLHLNTTQDIGHGMTIIFMCFVLVFFSVIIDLYTGVSAAKKLKEKIRSRILRKTINKILSYYSIMAFGIFIDFLGLCFPWYIIPYSCILATLACILIEGKSVIENHAKVKNPAAEIPETVMEIAEKISKSDLTSLKKIVEFAEKLNKKQS